MPIDEKERLQARIRRIGAGDVVLVRPGVTSESLTSHIAGVILQPDVPLFWFTVFAAAAVAACVMAVGIAILMDVGIGTMGNNIPVAWVFPIANYVWWIEIAVGGSLLSSILRLLNQKWRNSINRIAEAVTLAGIMCASLYPVLHLGRAWIFYWTIPYPNTLTIQPNFRSPLIWDVFGIFTYAAASVLFWYLDMIPDLAAVRDRAENRIAYLIFGVLAFGWQGSSKQWRMQEKGSLLLAGILTPLVFTVHTVVSFDFAIALVPGWHSTIFPPYFVDGAILAGISMVSMITIALRSAFSFENIITDQHLNNLGKIILTTSVFLFYIYCFDSFTICYGGNSYEQYTDRFRVFGNYAWVFWTFVAFGIAAPQLLWWKRNRTDPRALFVISLLVVIGMWEERYMLMVVSLSHDFMPSAWANFAATAEDNALLYGSCGLFLAMVFLLVRLFPMVPLHSVRQLLPHAQNGGAIE